MPRRLPRAARLALASAKLGLVGSMVVAGLATHPSTAPATQAGPDYAGYPVVDAANRETRMLTRHDCSVTGFRDATPASAVVRTARGHLRHVSFDEGWEVYTRRGAATLVAVCLAEAP